MKRISFGPVRATVLRTTAFVSFLASALFSQVPAHAEGRALSIGLGGHAFLQDAFGHSAPTGVNFPISWEYELKPRFSLGIHAGYRLSGELHQLTYGLLLKHYLQEDQDSLFRPYLEYGLLFLVSRLSGREGAGTSHDTQLTVGTDVSPRGGNATHFFVEASYHYSMLSYFEEKAGRLDVIQLAFGPRWRF